MRRFNFDRFQDAGLLILRVGIGIAMMFHGWPKVAGGPERWQRLADSVGIGFMPSLFGFLGAMIEFGGGALFALGLLFRPVSFFLFCMMAGAFWSHLLDGDGFRGFAHALKMAILFFAMIFVGAGRYSVDRYFSSHRRMGF